LRYHGTKGINLIETSGSSNHHYSEGSFVTNPFMTKQVGRTTFTSRLSETHSHTHSRKHARTSVAKTPVVSAIGMRVKIKGHLTATKSVLMETALTTQR
jgi:hypothetical protein